MEKEARKNNELVISRTFDAPRNLVWKALSEADRLAQWWGPKGFKFSHCKLEFKVGGIFHYCMQAPDGNEMWGKFVYREIVPQEKLVFVVSFSDAQGSNTRHPMAPAWPLETLNTLILSERDGKTTITLSGYPINATEAECKLFDDNHAGMNQGFKGTFDQLDEYLKTLTS